MGLGQLGKDRPSCDGVNGDLSLKRCPFCGSDNVHTFMNALSSDMPPSLSVVCFDCSGSCPGIDEWNRRA